VGARGARARVAVARPPEVQRHGHLPRGEVRDDRGDEVGADLLRAFVAEREGVLVEVLEAPEPDADERAAVVAVFLGELDGGVLQAQRRGGDREVGEAPHLTDLLLGDPLLGDEALHLARDAGREGARVKEGDWTDPGAALDDLAPGSLGADPVRRHEADARDDNAFHFNSPA
jgi:hypothetical protein